MLQYPNFSPDVFSIGPLTVRWYGFMYLLGFLSAWILGLKRSGPANQGYLLTRRQFEELLTWSVLGVILGGRFGYVLFYDAAYYFSHPIEIFSVWQGGMSFHGGLLGVLVALWLTGRKMGKNFFDITDFVSPLVPLGLFFGRIGNFINGELFGNPTDAPWGMIFPHGGNVPRHPSQLYEAILEGLVLFLILWFFSAKPKPRYAVSGIFALGYGIFRCFVEFFRQPDAHIGYMAFGFMTRGMLLCLPMIAVGLFLLWLAYGKGQYKHS